MVAQVDVDARGIVDPAAGLSRFSLDRFAPSAEVARFVDRYWVVTWDLTGQPPFTQDVYAHPVVNVIFADGTVTVHGVTTRIGSRVLEGAGRVLGIMFRPAGFRPFVSRPLTGITDQTVPAGDIFGPEIAELRDDVASAPDGAAMAKLADEFLAERCPPARQACEVTSELAERVAADPTFLRVDRLAAESGSSVRQLQRRFADHVGVTPKAVVRRYRIYEAAERARQGADLDWAALAAELGYSDQAHLIRDFSSALGSPPDRYARACRR
jgi:AraC-like DNA-binding protein